MPNVNPDTNRIYINLKEGMKKELLDITEDISNQAGFEININSVINKALQEYIDIYNKRKYERVKKQKQRAKKQQQQQAE